MYCPISTGSTTLIIPRSCCPSLPLILWSSIKEAPSKPNTIYLTRQRVRGKTLRDLILDRDPRIFPTSNPKSVYPFCLDLVGSMLDFFLRWGGVPGLMPTTQNVIVGDDGSFHLNYFSLLGLDFALHDKYIPKSQFQQMLPYLTSGYLELPQSQRMKFPLQMMLKFVMINFMSVFLGKDIVFEKNVVKMETQVCWKDAVAIVKQTEEKLLNKIINAEGWKKIREFDAQNGVKYTELLQYALGVSSTSITALKDSDISWDRVLRCLGREQLVTITGYSVDATERALQLTEALDHYTGIMSFLTAHSYTSRMQGLSPSDQQTIREEAARVENQRNQFISRGWYCKEVYLPVKLGLSWCSILRLFNWAHIFLQVKVPSWNTLPSFMKNITPNQSNIQAAQSLISLLTHIKGMIVLAEPVINSKVLRKTVYPAINNPLRAETQDPNSAGYYRRLQGKIVDNQIEPEEQQSREDTFKRQFWKEFHLVIDQGINMCRQYLLLIHQKQLPKSKFKASYNRHNRLLHLIKKDTPRMKVTQFEEEDHSGQTSIESENSDM